MPESWGFSSKNNASIEKCECSFGICTGNISQCSSFVMGLSLLMYVAFETTLRQTSADIFSVGAGSCVFVMITKKSLQQSVRYSSFILDALKRL